MFKQKLTSDLNEGFFIVDVREESLVCEDIEYSND